MIVHVFTPPERDYYELEQHWSGAKVDPPGAVDGATVWYLRWRYPWVMSCAHHRS